MKHFKFLSDIEFNKVLLLILLSGFTWTANAGVVKGVIKDKQNNEPLIGATVIISENNKGVTADIAGIYKLELPAGKYTLTVRLYKYSSHFLPPAYAAGGFSMLVRQYQK